MSKLNAKVELQVYASADTCALLSLRRTFFSYETKVYAFLLGLKACNGYLNISWSLAVTFV